MSRFAVALAAIVLAAPFFEGARLPAQTPACLHGSSEPAEHRTRRLAALEFARRLNMMEAEGYLQAQRYYMLEDLQKLLPAIPRGFKVQLSNDGASYAFSLKDTLDPCGFAYFSDQDGIVYSATPVPPK
jgi:hypothetical protein